MKNKGKYSFVKKKERKMIGNFLRGVMPKKMIGNKFSRILPSTKKTNGS